MTTLAVDGTVNRLRDQIRDAAERRAALRIRGSGTWMDAGRPVAHVNTLSTAELSGIISYVPGDLTMTMGGGTTLAEIRDATARNNQWLALDPHGVDEGTIGATTVTASAGPLATFFGTPRDLVLGVEFVTGAGVVARGGGRVVKNVAGFDLTRLFIGSWGTIGVVTEVTVRLHACPDVDRTFAIAIDNASAGRVRGLLRGLPFKPYACEIVNETLAAALLGNAAPAVLLRLAGNADGVEAQRRAFGSIGAASEISPDVWTKLRIVEPARASVVRLSDLPSEIERTWNAANVSGALVHASPARGIARTIMSDATRIASIASATRSTGAACVGERLPADQWRAFSPPHSELNVRVKQTFDPSNVLNPGILGESA